MWSVRGATFKYELSKPQNGAIVASRIGLGGIYPNMDFNLNQAIAVLARTPKALDALLRALPDGWVLSNEGDGSWSAFDIVGHLIVGERTDWMTRARVILEQGEAREFTPFDRFAKARETKGKSLDQLLDEFTEARAKSLAELEALHLLPKDLAKLGRHPRLGVVTLSQLLATWTAHDMTHLHQLARVMAHQYREAVGPWVAFLGVLRCEGHSAP